MAAAMQVAGTPLVVAPAPDWRSAQLTSGGWSYRPAPGGTEAAFIGAGGTQLAIRCTLATRTVSISRTGSIGGAPMLIRTTSAERTLPASRTLGAMDRLLDSIAFSRGRFAVEVAGVPRLVLPAWPEAARSIEDCRK